MGGSYPLLDIILFALVAGFLILRLRSVLGRRDGHEGPSKDPFGSPPRSEPPEDKVVRIPERPGQVAQPNFEGPGKDVPNTLEGGLTQIRIADPRFHTEEFLAGATVAFEMILSAFAAGDKASLKKLLSPEVFANFSQSIDERIASGETMSTEVVGMKSAEIVEAYMTGRTAHVTVKFVSQQVSFVRNEAGEVIEGDEKETQEVTDFWTFARDTRSVDPNWVLVATGSPDAN
jgi:predicted lipid-binding transport protein (Tim44 family)